MDFDFTEEELELVGPELQATAMPIPSAVQEILKEKSLARFSIELSDLELQEIDSITKAPKESEGRNTPKRSLSRRVKRDRKKEKEKEKEKKDEKEKKKEKDTKKEGLGKKKDLPLPSDSQSLSAPHLTSENHHSNNSNPLTSPSPIANLAPQNKIQRRKSANSEEKSEIPTFTSSPPLTSLLSTPNSSKPKSQLQNSESSTSKSKSKIDRRQRSTSKIETPTSTSTLLKDSCGTKSDTSIINKEHHAVTTTTPSSGNNNNNNHRHSINTAVSTSVINNSGATTAVVTPKINVISNTAKVVVMKIRMSNASHRSFPINPSTTAGEVLKKLESKLKIENPDKPELWEYWGSCKLFEVNLETGVTSPLDHLTKLLPLLVIGRDFVFKKEGEKEINREEELSRIQEENIRKKVLMEGALQSWIGGGGPTPNVPSSSSSNIVANTSIVVSHPSSFSLKHRYYFEDVDLRYNKHISNEQQYALNRIMILQAEITGLNLKLSSHKKLKKIPVDTSDITKIQQRSKDGRYIEIYSVLVGGWFLILKELQLEKSYPASIVDQMNNEINFYEFIPYHPNIVTYLFHEKTSSSIRIYQSLYSFSLRELIQLRRSSNTPFQIREIKLIISSLCNALLFLHSFCIIHRAITPENIYCDLHSPPQSQELHFCDDDNNDDDGEYHPPHYYNNSHPHNHHHFGDVQIDPQVRLGGFGHAFQVVQSNPIEKIVSVPSIYHPSEYKSIGYHYRSDIYSVGVIMLELMMLSLPKTEKELYDITSLEILQKFHSNSSLHHPSSVALVDIIFQCLDKHSSHRPSALVLKEMIDEIPDAKVNVALKKSGHSAKSPRAALSSSISTTEFRDELSDKLKAFLKRNEDVNDLASSL